MSYLFLDNSPVGTVSDVRLAIKLVNDGDPNLRVAQSVTLDHHRSFLAGLVAFDARIGLPRAGEKYWAVRWSKKLKRYETVGQIVLSWDDCKVKLKSYERY